MSMVIFALLRLAPGDIVDILFSTAGYVSPSEKQAIMKELGMDRPYGSSTSTGSARSSPATSANPTGTTSRPGRSSGRSSR